MKKSGLFWHIHHDVLVEYCFDYPTRVDFIKNNKPTNEIEARIFYLKPVKGRLPVEFTEACEAYDKVCEAYSKASEAYSKAYEACGKAYEAHGKAYEAHKQEIIALHEKECPNCIWDGEKLDFAKWKA